MVREPGEGEGEGEREGEGEGGGYLFLPPELAQKDNHIFREVRRVPGQLGMQCGIWGGKTNILFLSRKTRKTLFNNSQRTQQLLLPLA